MTQHAQANQLTPAHASLLLDRLIGDSAFRTLFTSDPGAALASIGIDASGCKDCLDVDVLASPEELQAVRSELESYLSTSTAAMTVIFAFEAGKVGETIG